jgi:hypothetical protein
VLTLASASAQSYYYSDYYYICVALYMCRHTTINVSAYDFSPASCPKELLCLCVRILVYVSSCCYICPYASIHTQTQTHTPIHRLFPCGEHNYEFLEGKNIDSYLTCCPLSSRRHTPQRERALALSLVFSSTRTHIAVCGHIFSSTLFTTGVRRLHASEEESTCMLNACASNRY